eukprot:Lankesteria_metandrocarpae@DN119_c0_g1_i1.p1
MQSSSSSKDTQQLFEATGCLHGVQNKVLPQGANITFCVSAGDSLLQDSTPHTTTTVVVLCDAARVSDKRASELRDALEMCVEGTVHIQSQRLKQHTVLEFKVATVKWLLDCVSGFSRNVEDGMETPTTTTAA